MISRSSCVNSFHSSSALGQGQYPCSCNGGTISTDALGAADLLRKSACADMKAQGDDTEPGFELRFFNKRKWAFELIIAQPRQMIPGMLLWMWPWDIIRKHRCTLLGEASEPHCKALVLEPLLKYPAKGLSWSLCLKASTPSHSLRNLTNELCCWFDLEGAL